MCRAGEERITVEVLSGPRPEPTPLRRSDTGHRHTCVIVSIYSKEKVPLSLNSDGKNPLLSEDLEVVQCSLFWALNVSYGWCSAELTGRQG